MGQSHRNLVYGCFGPLAELFILVVMCGRKTLFTFYYLENKDRERSVEVSESLESTLLCNIFPGDSASS